MAPFIFLIERPSPTAAASPLGRQEVLTFNDKLQTDQTIF